MARRQRIAIPVSLFPFLSILACVIGVLTLMITGLAIGQMRNKGENPEEVERAREFLRLKAQAEADEADAAELTRRIDDMQRNRRRETNARQALAKIVEQKGQFEANQRTAAELAAQLQEQEQQAAQLEADAARRKQELAATRKAIDDQNAKLAADPRVTVQPGGTGVDLAPTFVECDARGIVIHEGAEHRAIARAAMSTSLDYIGVLDRAAQRPRGTVIFLVRPAGVANYYLARSIARSRYCRNGKLPVPGDGPLDLSVFEEMLKR